MLVCQYLSIYLYFKYFDDNFGKIRRLTVDTVLRALECECQTTCLYDSASITLLLSDEKFVPEGENEFFFLEYGSSTE